MKCGSSDADGEELHHMCLVDEDYLSMRHLKADKEICTKFISHFFILRYI